MSVRIALPVCLACLSTAAYAVPYELPTSAERPITELKDGDGVIVCATYFEGACDVPPGTYRLHRFTPEWSDEARDVTIGGDDVGEPMFVRVSAKRDFVVNSFSFYGIGVPCPAGRVVASVSGSAISDNPEPYPVAMSCSGLGQTEASCAATSDSAAGFQDMRIEALCVLDSEVLDTPEQSVD